MKIRFHPDLIPQPVKTLKQVLGPEPLYAVCGIIRDSIRYTREWDGQTIRHLAGSDWDFTTPLRPKQVMERLRDAEITAVPIGIEHGTVAAVIDKIHYEITTYRYDIEYLDGRHPTVRFADSIEEDLKRRDFTVNAFALDMDTLKVIDLFNGLQDLSKGLIRTVGQPEERFQEDHLRMIRAARFACRLEGNIEENTFAAMKQLAYKILWISNERIRDEIMKMLAYAKPSIGFNLLHESGVLFYILPEFEMCYNCWQNRFHADDVAQHSLLTVDNLDPQYPFYRLCALLHDLGKATNKQYREDKQDYVFYGHQYASKRMGKSLMRRLRFSNKEIDQAAAIVENHMYNLKPDLSEAATRRFLRKIGRENLDGFLRMRMADRKGNRFNKEGYEKGLFNFLRNVRDIERAEDALSLRDLQITGNDLKSMALKPGPIFSQILESLLDEVIEEPSRNTRAWLLKRGRQYAEAYRQHGKFFKPPMDNNGTQKG